MVEVKLTILLLDNNNNIYAEYKQTVFSSAYQIEIKNCNTVSKFKNIVKLKFHAIILKKSSS